eukprot:3296550-Rhodomonas_salina.1
MPHSFSLHIGRGSLVPTQLCSVCGRWLVASSLPSASASLTLVSWLPPRSPAAFSCSAQQ